MLSSDKILLARFEILELKATIRLALILVIIINKKIFKTKASFLP